MRRRSYTKKVFMFYLPLCNHSPKTTSNHLLFSVLCWLQMPRFICNHLPPLFYPCFILVLFVAEAATLLAAQSLLWNGELPFAAQAAFKIISKVRLQINLHLPPYLPPLNLQVYSTLQRFLPKGGRWQMKKNIKI